MVDLSKYIGGKIKFYRELNNMTQDDLADSLGTTRQSVSRYENGDRKANQDILFDLADIFDISINNFFPQTKSISDIDSIYKQLNKIRKRNVYLYAEKQLQEQISEESINTVNDDKVAYITDYFNRDQQEINIQSKLSAGTGILDLDPENIETITYTGKLPTNYDLAFKVSGDSMEPVFEDGEIVFVRKQIEPINGAIMAVQIDEEAFIKKVYVEAERLRFVSLNKKYPDFYADNGNDIRIIGKVVY